MNLNLGSKFDLNWLAPHQPDSVVETMRHTSTLSDLEKSRATQRNFVGQKDDANFSYARGKQIDLGKTSIYIMPKGDEDPPESLYDMSCEINSINKEKENTLTQNDNDGSLLDRQRKAVRSVISQKVSAVFNNCKQTLEIKEDKSQLMQSPAALKLGKQKANRSTNRSLLKSGSGTESAMRKMHRANGQEMRQAPIRQLPRSGLYPNLQLPISNTKYENKPFSCGRNESMSSNLRKRVRFNELLNSGVYIEQIGFTPVKNVSCIDPFEKNSEVLQEQRYHWMKKFENIPYVGCDGHLDHSVQYRKDKLNGTCLKEQHAWLQAKLHKLNAKPAGSRTCADEQIRNLLIKRIALVEKEIETATSFEKNRQSIAHGLDHFDDVDLIRNLDQAYANRKRNKNLGNKS